MSDKQTSLLFVLQTWSSFAPPLCLKGGDKDFIRNLLLSLDQILLQGSWVRSYVFNIFQILFSSLKISKAGEYEDDWTLRLRDSRIPDEIDIMEKIPSF